MGIGNCIKGIFLLLTAGAGLVGTLIVLYSGVTVFDRDLAQAQKDGLEELLKPFIKCDDLVNQQLSNTSLSGDANTRLVLEAACQYQHTPALTLFCVGGVFALFSVLSGLVSGCKDVKGNLYAYTVISGTSLALLVTSMFWMNAMTTDAAKWLTACEKFSSETIDNIHGLGFICVESNETAKQFLARVATFYGGAIVSILSLLSFLLMNSCASDAGKKGPLASSEVASANYGYNRA
jgi:hypothetical protein